MRWRLSGPILAAAMLATLPVLAQEDQGCRDWRADPARAVDGCTRLLNFLETSGSARWLYKEKGDGYAYFGRAEAHAASGENDLAIADYTLSIRNDPSAVAYNNRGNIHVRKGDLAAAESDFAEAVRLEPTNEVAKTNLADVQEARRRTPPKPAAASEGSAYLAACTGGSDFDDALVACYRALYGTGRLTDGQRAEAYAARGRIQLYRHDYAGAADDLAEAVKLSPDEPFYRMQLDQALAWRTDAAAAAPTVSQRELVRRAQAALAKLGYAPGAADGRAGARTAAAVRAYQRQASLAADGAVTAELVARLEAQPR